MTFLYADRMASRAKRFAAGDPLAKILQLKQYEFGDDETWESDNCSDETAIENGAREGSMDSDPIDKASSDDFAEKISWSDEPTTCFKS